MGEKITIDIQSFYELTKVKAREEILKSYVTNTKTTFVDKDTVKTILGIEEKGE